MSNKSGKQENSSFNQTGLTQTDHLIDNKDKDKENEIRGNVKNEKEDTLKQIMDHIKEMPNNLKRDLKKELMDEISSLQ